jgi:hypothetical protein
MTDELDTAGHAKRTARTAQLVDQLNRIVLELEQMHPGRRFPLDGHLVGSIGEAAAEAMFRLRLVTASTAGHDALADDGRAVEIKATYGTSGVGLRSTSHDAAAALIVLRLSRDADVPHEVVYSGSLDRVAHAAGSVQSNGQARLGLNRLRVIDATVPAAERIPPR